MKPRNNNNTWKYPIKMFIIFLVLFCIIILQFGYISLFPSVYGINIKKFATNRNTVSTVLRASRGNIFDSSGNALAINVTSYTVIAYLSSTRTTDSSNPKHVVDIDYTASKLSPILNMSEETLKKLLSSSAYQVELGPGGRGITEVKKKEIADLELPGIDFIEDQKRYYPNGDFASYIIGYAKKNEDGEIIGELGIESKYNDALKGMDGSLKYQRNIYGYKIPDTPEEKIDAVNGDDIYLTIDSGVQRFLEDAIKSAEASYPSDWMTITVMDAKTGKILGSAATPSYNPNILNITNYENPLVSYAFEPGSTMKTYAYMCAIENGRYNGSDTFQSGSIKSGDKEIFDWNRTGWGPITYDLGYEYSSNVGVSYLVKNNIITKSELKECYEKYGFGQKTGIELSREVSGKIKFNYEIEVYSAAFGQGILTTPIQQLQALTLISNNGKMLKPYIIDKIVNNKGEVTYQGTKQESEQIVKESTVEKMKELMYNVVNNKNEGTTGTAYRVDGLDVIGKTGTAQLYENGKYLNQYIYSAALIYPKDDPQLIIYGAIKKPVVEKSRGLYLAIRDIIKNTAKYYNINGTNNEKDTLNEYTIENYINKSVKEVSSKLKNQNLKVVVIGDGDKIIDQYPSSNQKIIENERVILITNSDKIKMPSLSGWSKKEVEALMKLINVNYQMNGYGYVTNQSIEPGTVITNDIILTIDLKDNYVEKNQDKNTNESEKTT